MPNSNFMGKVVRITQIPRNRKILIILFLILATLFTFEQLRKCEFLNFDDNLYVTNNPMVKAGLTARGAIWAFTTKHAANWHPMTWLSHMLDCELYGLSPGAHHLTNVLLHIGAALLLLLVLVRMTGELWKSSFVAALFAIHPLHVESVAWVAERKDVLSTLFWMLTLWTYFRYVDRPGFLRYAAVLAFFALGLLSKPMLVTLPFVLFLLDYWPLGRIKFGHARFQNFLSASRKTNQKSPLPSVGGDEGEGGPVGPYFVHPLPHPPPSKGGGNVVLEKIPFFVLAAASSVMTFLAQREGGAVGSLEIFPLGIRIANALISYVKYIEKMIWPRNLSVFYPYPDTLPAWQAVGAALLLICISILVIRASRSRPYLAVGWLWYLGTLVPVIGVVQVGLQAMADRYTYVPLIGLFLMVATGLPDLLPKWRSRRVVLAVTAGILIPVLMFVTRSQVRHWLSSITLFEHALNVTTDNSMAHTNLGVALTGQGKYLDAMAHYKEALRIKPNNATAHVNLGVNLAQQGRYQEAIDYLSKVLRTDPHDTDALYNLGLILARHGRYQEAIGHFAEALRVNPMDPEVRYNLGLALTCIGKDQEAISHYTTAVRINPNFGNAYYNLGLALARQGKDQEALSSYGEALRISPRDPEAHHDMGIALSRLGKHQDAVLHFNETLRIKPRHPKAHYNLGLTLAQQGKHQEALVQYDEALKINPDDADAHNNMGVSLARLEKYREALPRFAEAVRIRPDFAEARLSLALANLMIGNRTQAVEQYRILQKIDPDMARALGQKMSE